MELVISVSTVWLRELDIKKIAEIFDSFEMCCWRRIEKIKGKVTNEVTERIGEKRAFLKNILRREEASGFHKPWS